MYLQTFVHWFSCTITNDMCFMSMLPIVGSRFSLWWSTITCVDNTRYHFDHLISDHQWVVMCTMITVFTNIFNIILAEWINWWCWWAGSCCCWWHMLICNNMITNYCSSGCCYDGGCFCHDIIPMISVAFLADGWWFRCYFCLNAMWLMSFWLIIFGMQSTLQMMVVPAVWRGFWCGNWKSFWWRGWRYN